MLISTFPRDDYDEDEYLLKHAELRDTHSEGKVTRASLDANRQRTRREKWKARGSLRPAGSAFLEFAVYKNVEAIIDRPRQGNMPTVPSYLFKAEANLLTRITVPAVSSRPEGAPGSLT